MIAVRGTFIPTDADDQGPPGLNEITEVFEAQGGPIVRT